VRRINLESKPQTPDSSKVLMSGKNRKTEARVKFDQPQVRVIDLQDPALYSEGKHFGRKGSASKPKKTEDFEKSFQSLSGISNSKRIVSPDVTVQPNLQRKNNLLIKKRESQSASQRLYLMADKLDQSGRQRNTPLKENFSQNKEDAKPRIDSRNTFEQAA
jgi:hypothetical protein